MTQLLGPLKWYAVCLDTLQAVQAALTYQVQRAGVVPGMVAWDACDCGMMAVSVVKSWLSDTFPDPEFGVVGNCTAAWEVSEIVVQIVRCAPSDMDAVTPYPPSPALDTAAQVMATDAFDVLSSVAAMLCQLKDSDQISDYVIGEQVPMGPEGGCVGTELHFTVGLPRG